MYCHLQLKTEYSICSSTIPIKKAVKFAKNLRFKTLAICDDYNLFGSLEFASECVSSGIKPIIGVTMVLHKDLQTPLGKISLFAQNEEGYQNLLAITNSQEAINNSGTILLEYMKQNYVGLFAISPSVDVLNQLIAIYPQSSVFAEINRFTNEQHEVDAELPLVEFACKNNIPLLATNPSYFLQKEEFISQDSLLCVKNGRFTLEDDRPQMTLNHNFKSHEEITQLFQDIPHAVNHTNYIAEGCNYYPKPQKPILPKFAENESAELIKQAYDGLDQRLQDYGITKNYTKEDYQKRLDYEISVVSSMGFEGYFLIVSDFIKWSKANGVAVGPGRGSGAGSLVAYCLYITDLDPFRYGLLFERFLNPERVSMPDFDIDFCQEERHKVIEYVQKRYGEKQVAAIVTFGRLQARAVLKDVGRVLQIPYPVVDRICKLVPFNPVAPVTLEQAIAMDKDLQQQKVEDDVISNLIDISINLEGLIRHISTHAAGIIIGNQDLTRFAPLYKADDQDIPAVGYSMKMAENYGLVKFDFLGLKTLTMIKKACQLVKKNHNIEIIPDKIPLDDEKTFKLLQEGLTKGVFQLDSAICRDAMKQMKVDMIDDIIALTSLNRPGPMENLPSFILRKIGKEKVDYPHPLLENVLNETFGIIIYQEQVINIARVLAGYSLGEADLLRRAMGKKDKNEMDKQKARFVDGAKTNNIDSKKADEIFALVEKFAGYGFNKSHAAAYSVISFYTAYIKAHYPLEFYTSLLNLEINNTDNINIFISEARHAGIEFVMPNVNTSNTEFTIKNGKIEYALSAIKGVGEMATNELENERTKNGKFLDICDFSERLGSKYANKKVLEGLIKAGAFSTLHPNGNELLANIQTILNFTDTKTESTQDSLFGVSEIKTKPQFAKTPEFTPNELLLAEFDAFGFYLSKHPLSNYEEDINKNNIKSYTDVLTLVENTSEEIHIKMAGVISILKQRSGKRGRFAFLHISDLTGVFEVAIFRDELIEKHRDILGIGSAIVMNISASKHESGNARLIVNDIASINSISNLSTLRNNNNKKQFEKDKKPAYTPPARKVEPETPNPTPHIAEQLSKDNKITINLAQYNTLKNEIKALKYGHTAIIVKHNNQNIDLGNFAVPQNLANNINN
jgi:DNA polymerase-3 subunit alpha